MSDELNDKFRNLVADPPPPTAVPSEAVFARVRTVRRRRAAGVTVVAAAAVAAIAVAGTSLTNLNSSPPATNTPSAPATIATSPPKTDPTTGPTTTAPTNTGHTTTGGPTTTGPTNTGRTTTGSTSTNGTTTGTPAPPPPAVSVVLKPTVSGRSMTMTVTLKGTVLVPRYLEGGKYMPADTSFLNLSFGTDYTFGDGESGGSDGQTVTCKGSKKWQTGRETYVANGPDVHVYKKPGTYTYKYTVRYCGTTVTETAKIVIR